MKQTKTMLRLELEVKPEVAVKCQLAAMVPMTVMVTGRRSILLASRSPSPSLGPLLPGDISRLFPASPPAPAGASFLSVS